MTCTCGRTPDPGICPLTHDGYIGGGHCTCVHETAVPVSSPPPDQTALRDRIAEAPADWTDGHPQLEAIAAAVWEHCEHSGSGLVIDDPRNIAVVALNAVLAALTPPADRAAVLSEAADFAEETAEKLRAHHEFERSTGALDVMTELRRLAAEAQQPDTETRTSWTPGPVALARAADWATKRQDATVDPAMCPRCKGDNSEAFQLCAACATPEPPVHKGGNADDCPA